MNNNLAKSVKKYISQYKLNTRSKVRERVYKRAYLCAFLRSTTTLSLEAIGDYFDRDHATVIHYINNIHNRYIDYGDVEYLDSIRGVAKAFPIPDGEAITASRKKVGADRQCLVTLKTDLYKRLKVYMVLNDIHKLEDGIKRLIQESDLTVK